jgi:hypothetical protein
MLAQAMGRNNTIEEDFARLGRCTYMMTDLLQAFLCTIAAGEVCPRLVPAHYFGEQRAIECRAEITAVSPDGARRFRS